MLWWDYPLMLTPPDTLCFCGRAGLTNPFLHNRRHGFHRVGKGHGRPEQLVRLSAEEHSSVLDLEPLSNLSDLSSLDLGGSQWISDIGPLARLARLEFLSLRDCTFPSEGLEALGGLSGLKGLCLPPDITEEQLASICQAYRDLEFLSLRGCWRVTSLAPLFEIHGLRVVQLDERTKLSEAQITAFKEKIPGCRTEMF